MVKYFMIGLMLVGVGVAMPLSASAQKAKGGQTASGEDPNDKSAKERDFEETRKHMQLHSEWSKKTGKMNDN